MALYLTIVSYAVGILMTGSVDDSTGFLQLVLSCTRRKQCVGYKGKLPWEDSPYKNDMKMFRELTTENLAA